MSIFSNIQINYHTLSKTEQKIADYLLEHRESLLNIHIRELAEKTKVSEATITRFSKKVGCKSFVELKILLREGQEEAETDESIIGQVNYMYDSILKATRSMKMEEKLKKSVNLINDAEKIAIYGVESSGLSAMEMKKRMQRMGYKVDVETDSHGMIINSSLLGKKDLIIAISNSGHTKEIVDACELAKKNSVPVIAITNYNQTPLSKTADLILFTYNLKTQELKGLINSQFSMMYIMDLISMYLLKQKKTSDQYRQTVKALNDYKKI